MTAAKEVFTCQSCGDATFIPPKCDECYTAENQGDKDYVGQLQKRVALANKIAAETQTVAEREEQRKRTQEELEAKYEQQRQDKAERKRQQREAVANEMAQRYEQQRQAKLQSDLAAQRAKDEQFLQQLVGVLQGIGFELIEQPEDTAQVKALRVGLARIIKRKL